MVNSNNNSSNLSAVNHGGKVTVRSRPRTQAATTLKQQQQQQTVPGNGQVWRPGYNQTAPGAGGTQDPNRNG